MGIDIYNMTWDFGQDVDISQARTAAQQLSRTAMKAKNTVDDLERRFTKLVLINAAMAQLLEEKLGITQQEISDYAAQMLHKRKPLNKCHSCGAALSQTSKQLNKCLYCGAEKLKADDLFGDLRRT